MTTSQSTMDIVSSLSQDDIPIKLRCASCNNLVLDAFRLPCCDQNICQTCQSHLPDTCPVCSHSPLVAADCKPNKSLRLTIKAFLKSEEKKREKEKGANPISVPQTPTTSLVPVQPEVASNAESKDAGVQRVDPVVHEARDDENVGAKSMSDVQLAVPPANENPKNTGTKDEQDIPDKSVEDAQNPRPLAMIESQAANVATSMQPNESSVQMAPQFGFGGNPAAFSGMNWNQMNAFNPMMQMQMQNSMASGNWGYPNMMAMGMNQMDMSQGMYGGYGMQGMVGMNGMMSNGMDFGSGYGWNNGQHSGNTYATGGGYNQNHQGQYSHQSVQNNFQNQNHSHGQASIPRKSSIASQSHSNQGNESVIQSIERSASAALNGVSADIESHQAAAVRSASKGAVDQSNDLQAESNDAQPNQESTSAQAQTSGNGEYDANNATELVEAAPSYLAHTNSEQNPEGGHSDDKQYVDGPPDANEIQVMNQYENANGFNQGQMYMQDGMEHTMAYNNHYSNNQNYNMAGFNGGFAYSGRGRGRGRGGWGGRGAFHHQHYSESHMMNPVQPLGQGVEGAPTGPKAMRDGFSNRGSFRGRGVLNNQRGGIQGAENTNSSNRAPSSVPQTPLVGASGAQEEVDGLVEQSHTEQRSISRSRSRSHSRSRRHRHRRRSQSASSDPETYDRDREHRRHDASRFQKYEDDVSARYEDDFKEDIAKSSREPSVDGNKRHRSSRHEKDGHRSSRSHRDHSRERRKRSRRSRSARREAGDHDLDYESTKPITETSKRKSRSDRRRDDEEKEKGRHRDRNYEHEREKYRERDREDRRRSRRDRSVSYESEDNHRSSKSGRRDKDKTRTRERRRDDDQRDNHKDHEPEITKQPNSVNNGDQIEFRIQGRANEQRASSTAPASLGFNPPTGPSAARAPPTGPRVLNTKITSMNPPSGPSSARRSQPPTPATSEHTSGPPTPAIDPHTLEREARNRERMLKEEQRRQQLRGGGSSSAGLERKRSYADDGDGGSVAPPTGPRGDRDRKTKSRRVNYKYEDEENDEARARRVEKQREASRWN